MLRHLLLIASVLLPGIAAAQGGIATRTAPIGPLSPTMQLPKDTRILLLPQTIDLQIEGQGTLTVSGQTCASKAGQTATGCTISVPGQSTYQAVAVPAEGLSVAAWGWQCADRRLETTCAFKLNGATNGHIVAVTFGKGVPLTLKIPSGPGTVDEQVVQGPVPTRPIQCSVGAQGVQAGVCETLASIGSQVLLKPVAGQGATFKGFAGAPGCSADKCLFTVTGPTTVTAAFAPAATLVVDVAALKSESVSVQLDAPNHIQCEIMAAGSAAKDKLHCVAQVPPGQTVAIKAYWHPGSLPANTLGALPKDWWGGACAGQGYGTCTLVMNGDKHASIDSPND